MPHKVHLLATVVFLTREQGGFLRPHGPGIRPVMKVRDDAFTSCIVWADDAIEVFEPGVEYEVKLELPLWVHYRDGIRAGMPLQLGQGMQVVARGTIVAILA